MIPIRKTNKAERLEKMREIIKRNLDQIELLFRVNFNSDPVEISQFHKRLADLTEKDVRGD